jgi:glycerate 2-kinase
MPAMRVVVCPDSVGPLGPASATEALAAGWPEQDVVRRPCGEAGAGFLAATAARWGVEVLSEPVGGRLMSLAVADRDLALALPAERSSGPIPVGVSSAPLGSATSIAIERHRPERVWIDLVSDDVHDGGAGFLAAAGSVALEDLEIVGVVPEGERQQRLLGLRGITSLRGRAAGEDPARLLAVDAELGDWADSLGVPDQPGAGACGGVGLAILALGGRLATGPELSLGDIAGPVDLLVTGCTSFDFASRGGGVVSSAARLAAELLCPCVVVAGEVLIGGREMRTMGVEAAYGLEVPAAEISAERLQALAVRIGRSWRW